MSRIRSHRRATSAFIAALLVTSALALTRAAGSSADPSPTPDAVTGSIAVPNAAQVQLSRDGAYSYVRSTQPGLAVYRNSDGALIATIDGQGHEISDVTVDPADGRIIVDDQTYQNAAIGLIDPSTYDLTWFDIDSTKYIYGLTVDASGTRVYTRTADLGIAYFDLATMTLVNTGLNVSYSFPIGLSPDGTKLYTIMFDITNDVFVQAYSLTTNTRLGSTLLVEGGPAAYPTATVTATGEVYGSNYDDIWQFDTDATQKIRHIDSTAGLSGVGITGLSSSRSGKTLYATSNEYTVANEPVSRLSGIDTATGETRFSTITGHNLLRVNLDRSGATAASIDYTEDDAAVVLFALSDIVGSTPGAPTDVSVATKAHGAGVSFTAPTDSGTGSITGYTVTATDTTDPTQNAITADGTASPIALFGLTGGHTYTVTVTARNAIGASADSDPSSPFVARYPQTITVANLPVRAVVGDTYVLKATGGDSHAPVTFGLATTTTNDACAVSSGMITFVHAGACRVLAEQRGSKTYEPALPTTITVRVHRAAQAITFRSAPPEPALTGTSYDLTVTSTGAATGTFLRVVHTSRGICSLDANGFTVHLAKVGTCVVRANQPRSADYLSAARIEQTIVVTEP